MVNNQKVFHSELEAHAIQLYNLVDIEASKEETSVQIVEIERLVELLRQTFEFQRENPNEKTIGWLKVENRMNRAKRLLDLGAPKIIKLHEINWLKLEINRLGQIFDGITPKYTEEQEEELKSLQEIEADFLND